jgi:hypothetical protein
MVATGFTTVAVLRDCYRASKAGGRSVKRRNGCHQLMAGGTHDSNFLTASCIRLHGGPADLALV